MNILYPIIEAKHVGQGTIFILFFRIFTMPALRSYLQGKQLYFIESRFLIVNILYVTSNVFSKNQDYFYYYKVFCFGSKELNF